MFFAAGGEVDAGGVDGRMTEHVCQAHNVAAGGIKNGGKKMAQIVREHFLRVHTGTNGEVFHLAPYLSPGQTFSACGEKEFTAGDFLFCGVVKQFAAEAFWQENDTNFAFKRNVGTAAAGCFNGDVGEFGHTHAGGAERFHNQCQPLVATFARSGNKTVVVAAVKFARGIAKRAALDF